MRQAKLKPCKTADTIVYNSNEQRYLLWYDRIKLIHIIDHRRGCRYTGAPIDQVYFQSLQLDNIRCFNITRRLRWKSLIFTALLMSPGIWLYTKIKPSALRRSISRKSLSLMSTSCRACRMLALCLFRADDAVKKALKWSGPLSRAHRWMSPLIAIFLLHDNGARLNW